MSILTEPVQYFGNAGKNYKDLTRRMGCEVSRPMTNPQPTDEGISSKLDNAVGKAIQNRKNEIIQIHRQTSYSLEQIIELALKNGLELTAKSISPGRRHKILHEEEVKQ